MVRLIFKMLIDNLGTGAATKAIRLSEEDSGAIFYADAMASKDQVGIGGYEAAPGRALIDSPWFSEVISPEDAPWVFEHGEDQAFRKIATLELVASIACVRLFGKDTRHEGRAVTLSGVTDNKGNGHIVSKLFSTKYPICAAVMQLTSDLNDRGAELDLVWRPREENVLADALSNGRCEGFDPRLRKRFDIKDLKVLKKVLLDGKALYDEARAEKDRRKLLARDEAIKERLRPTRKPEDKLRNRDPWE